MYLIAAIMQGVLLLLCLAWKRRQHRLGIDDFGVPTTSVHGHPYGEEEDVRVGMRRGSAVEDGETVGEAVEEAVEERLEGVSEEPEEVESDGNGTAVAGGERDEAEVANADESTTLLGKRDGGAGEMKSVWARLMGRTK